MYSYIKGKIVDNGENFIVLENNGIGYELTVTGNTLSKILETSDNAKVYCYLNVREDGINLFGFASEQEKNMFLKLISVSGVGPKLAIMVLSGMTAEQFATAVVKSDVKSLSKIKGVGKKTAERIALELRDIVSKTYDATIEADVVVQSNQNMAANEDAVLALMTLGYSKSVAETAVLRVQKDGMKLEDIVYSAIKNA